MKELHHKVPRFLGGSERRYNLEYVTPKEHFIRHLIIARELNTFSAWAAVVFILNKYSQLGLFRKHWFNRQGLSMRGEGHPRKGKPYPRGKDAHNYNKGRSQEVKDKFKGEKNPMYGRNNMKNPRFNGWYISPKGEKFACRTEAGLLYSIPRSTLYRWAKQNKNGWSFEPKENNGKAKIKTT